MTMSAPPRSPKWLHLGNKLSVPVFRAAEATLGSTPKSNLDTKMTPLLALYQINACLNTVVWANANGYHAVAMCLLRQCIEALTVFELGLQPAQYADAVLQQWRDGKITHGELRAKLEKDVWPKYGSGLWDEPWAEFFGNLARSVQPYAHYSPSLMEWQKTIVHHKIDQDRVKALKHPLIL